MGENGGAAFPPPITSFSFFIQNIYIYLSDNNSSRRFSGEEKI